MSITFKTSLDFMTYKHYLDQPTPMVERLGNRKLKKLLAFKNPRRYRTDITHGNL